jgi:exosome complex exonuclease DIS3/RRP44
MTTPNPSRRRKLDEIITPPSAKATAFIEDLKLALADSGIRIAFKDIFKEVIFQEVRALKAHVRTLERKIEDLEQYSRRSCVMISGFPDSPNEKSTDAVVLKLAKAMDIEVEVGDISRSHRLPTRVRSDRPRDIVVSFTTYNMRHKFHTSRSKLKDSPEYRGKVYINEHLTSQRNKVFYESRQAKKRGKLVDTWTYDGKIMVKFNDAEGNETRKPVTTIDELNKIIGDASVSESNSDECCFPGLTSGL